MAKPKNTKTAVEILDRLLERWWPTARPGEAPRMQRFAAKYRRRLIALARPLAERGQPQIMPRDDAPLWRRLADVIDSLDFNERLEFIYEGRHQVTPKWAGPGFVTMDAIGNASQEWPDAKSAAEHIVNLLGTRRAHELAEAWEAGRTRVAVDEDGARSYVTPADDLARALRVQEEARQLRVDDAEPDQSTTLDELVKISADRVEDLRPIDVHRVLKQARDWQRNEPGLLVRMATELASRKNDAYFVSSLIEAVADIDDEYGDANLETVLRNIKTGWPELFEESVTEAEESIDGSLAPRLAAALDAIKGPAGGAAQVDQPRTRPLPTMFPTIHLNGTGPETLLAHLENALQAVKEAMAAPPGRTAKSAVRNVITMLELTAPNGRDFYVQGPEAIRKASDEYVSRVGSLQDATPDQYRSTLRDVAEDLELMIRRLPLTIRQIVLGAFGKEDRPTLSAWVLVEHYYQATGKRYDKVQLKQQVAQAEQALLKDGLLKTVPGQAVDGGTIERLQAADFPAAHRIWKERLEPEIDRWLDDMDAHEQADMGRRFRAAARRGDL